jgi:Carboxypeptidase regulatory-like domain
MRTVCFRALAVTALLGLAMAIHAADMTKLTVVVKTQAGRPVDRAEVIVRWKADAKHPRLSYGKNVQRQFDIRTDQEGQVEVPAIPQGSIQIQVYARGYQTFGKIYEIYDETKTVEVTVNPPQQQYSAH